MFNVLKTTEKYSRNGKLISSSSETVFSSNDLVETAKYRYSHSKNGHAVEIIVSKHGIFLSTEYEGKRLKFSEIYRMVEGEDAHSAILNADGAWVSEQEWVASK